MFRMDGVANHCLLWFSKCAVCIHLTLLYARPRTTIARVCLCVFPHTLIPAFSVTAHHAVAHGRCCTEKFKMWVLAGQAAADSQGVLRCPCTTIFCINMQHMHININNTHMHSCVCMCTY